MYSVLSAFLIAVSISIALAVIATALLVAHALREAARAVEAVGAPSTSPIESREQEERRRRTSSLILIGPVPIVIGGGISGKLVLALVIACLAAFLAVALSILVPLAVSTWSYPLK